MEQSSGLHTQLKDCNTMSWALIHDLDPNRLTYVRIVTYHRGLWIDLC